MDDPILNEFRKKIQEMKKKSLASIEQANEETPAPAAPAAAPAQETTEAEPKHKTENSIWVGNLDQTVTEEKLNKEFSVCGQIVKITIPTKAGRYPTKYAYIEFMNPSSVEVALKLNDHLFCGKNIEVKKKRDNIPGKAPRRRRFFRRF